MLLPVWQAPLALQQPAQLDGPQVVTPVQVPAEQVSPLGHVWQTPPPAPQALVTPPGSQLLPLQHPGQLDGPQAAGPWHWP